MPEIVGRVLRIETVAGAVRAQILPDRGYRDPLTLRPVEVVAPSGWNAVVLATSQGKRVCVLLNSLGQLVTVTMAEQLVGKARIE